MEAKVEVAKYTYVDDNHVKIIKAPKYKYTLKDIQSLQITEPVRVVNTKLSDIKLDSKIEIKNIKIK